MFVTARSVRSLRQAAVSLSSLEGGALCCGGGERSCGCVSGRALESRPTAPIMPPNTARRRCGATEAQRLSGLGTRMEPISADDFAGRRAAWLGGGPGDAGDLLCGEPIGRVARTMGDQR